MKDEEIRIRKSWPKTGFNPETKIEAPKKGSYKRSSNKQEIEAALEEMEQDLDFDI